MLYFLFRRRALYSLGLLVMVLAHFVLAHHEGQPELVLCQFQNQVSLEASTGHGEAEEHACEHGESCHDVHLSFYHPETYSIQTVPPVDQHLDQLATVVNWELFLPEIAVQPPRLLASAHLLPEAQPPPDEPLAALSTVILLI